MIAIAPIAVVMVALMFALIAWASWQLLRPIIENILGGVPVVGGWLLEREQSLLASFILGAQPAINAGISPLADLLRHLDQVPRNYLFAAANAHRNALNLLTTIRQHLIPEAEARARAFATAAVAGLEAGIAGGLAALRGELAQVVAQGLANAQALIVAGLLGARADFNAAVAALRGDLAGVEASSRAYADAGLRGLQDWTQHRTGDLYDALGRARADLRTYVDSGVGAAAAAAAAAVAGVAVRVKQIEDSPCQQSCDVLGNLGGELEGLELGLILAAVGVMARDPLNVGRQIATEAGPDLQEAASAFRDLVAAL